LKTSLSRLDEEMDEEDDEVAVEELFGETYPSRLDRNVEQEACAELELRWRTERVTRFASHSSSSSVSYHPVSPPLAKMHLPYLLITSISPHALPVNHLDSLVLPLLPTNIDSISQTPSPFRCPMD
jgi:hypothetical protein